MSQIEKGISRPVTDMGLSIDAPVSIIPAIRRQQHEAHSAHALAALLEVATILVDDKANKDDVQTTAARLLTLISEVLQCQHTLMAALTPESETRHVLALTGFTAEQAARVRELIDGKSLTDTLPDADGRAGLADGNMLVLNMRHPFYHQRLILPTLEQILYAPMMLDAHLIGYIALYYTAPHTYTTDEIALIEAICKFAVLVLEQEWLRHEQRTSHAHEQALREANQLMDDFLGITGHELRTPLTALQGNVQIAQLQLSQSLQAAQSVPAAVTQSIRRTLLLLERAEQQAGVLNRLVQDLQNVARVQVNRLDIRLARCNLITIVSESVHQQLMLTPEQIIHYKTTTPGQFWLIADADRIGQVMMNYLSNALKYTATGKQVAVRLERQGAVARVSVRDEGPGIAPEEQGRIWERFYQVRNVSMQGKHRRGLGLGLHICHTIIELHGGQVGVESTPGQGSTFWFTLPLLATTDAEARG